MGQQRRWGNLGHGIGRGKCTERHKGEDTGNDPGWWAQAKRNREKTPDRWRLATARRNAGQVRDE